MSGHLGVSLLLATLSLTFAAPNAGVAVGKCCAQGKAVSNSSCVASPEPFAPPFADSDVPPYHYVINPCNLVLLQPSVNPYDAYSLLRNGSLSVPGICWAPFPASEYCLDRDVTSGATVALICVEWQIANCPEAPVAKALAFKLYPGFMILSTLCLVATTCTYMALPHLCNLHGLTLISHVFALTFAYIFLSVVQIGGNSISEACCTSFAFIIYFSFLASFFWLNVMCLDIFWTFSGFRSLRGTVKEREFKKFIIYSIYSWGCPLIMLTVCLVMHFHEGISDDYVKPGFGITACWFKDTTSALAYFYGPVAVLILCNIILFILTAVKIAKLKREAEMFNNSESRRHDDEDNKQRFNLYLKLFLVMGVNWATEIISWAAGGPEYLWYLTDIANTLQGVLIFIIFVWKDRIRKLLMERFCPKRAAAATASKSTAITYSTRGSSSISSVKPGGKINQESLRMTNMVTSEESDVP